MFAAFYDAVQGDRAEHAAYLSSLVEKHRSQAESVLELAAAPGRSLAHLQARYQVTGVDRSEKMLKRAAE